MVLSRKISLLSSRAIFAVKSTYPLSHLMTLRILKVKSVFAHCWVEKSGMSADKLWIRDANVSENIGWLHYITKEAEYGNTETWDFENTQIPHKALAMDLS